MQQIWEKAMTEKWIGSYNKELLAAHAEDEISQQINGTAPDAVTHAETVTTISGKRCPQE